MSSGIFNEGEMGIASTAVLACGIVIAAVSASPLIFGEP
jgi:hypothetical protein